MRATGRLPRLSTRLGVLTRTNSEAIIGAARQRYRGDDFSHGVAITSSFYPDEDTHIEPTRYGPGSNAMGSLATLLVDGGGRTPRWAKFFGQVVTRPWELPRVFNLRHWSGKHRPGYEAVMAAAARGEIDVILVFQSSRFWRNRRERAEGIEVLRNAGVSLIASKGPSLDMSTAYGRGMAGLLGEFDTMESEVKAERQQLAAFHRAENGQPPAGVRLTGYTMAGAVAEHEAAAVRQMFARFHAGDSLRGIVAWLAAQGVPTRSGRPWNPSSVRSILTNPRYAGRVVYRGQYPGEVGGRMGAWPPLVEEWLFDAVQATLSDPRRRKQVGTDRKHLGSGLYLCGVCDHPVRANTSTQNGRQQLRYWCPQGGHVTRSAAPVDDLVLGAVRARLAKPDLRTLLAKPVSKEARQAAEEIRRLRGRLEQTRLDYDNDLIDGARYKAKTAKLQAQLDATEVAQARLMAGSEVAGTFTAPDPVAAFDQAPLGAQRAVIAFLMTVRLDPAPRGRHFSPESVRIDWREHRGAG